MGAGSSAGHSKAKYDKTALKERYGDSFDEAKYAELVDEQGFVSAEQLRVMEEACDAAVASAVDGVGSTAGGAPPAIGAAAARDAAAAAADAPTGAPAAAAAPAAGDAAAGGDAAAAAAAAAPAASADAPIGAPAADLLEKTTSRFQSSTTIPKLHKVAQKKYDVFNSNRTAELYRTFFGLVGDGAAPDFSESKFRKEFSACVPFPGKTNERPVYGMAKGSTPHGLIRYEFKGCSIEECRVNGREHGLRVVCTQMGDYWIRLFANGERLAQIVLSSDCSVGGGPTIDDGGLEVLRNHLHLVTDCLKSRT